MKRDAEGRPVLEPDEMAEIRRVLLEERQTFVDGDAEVRALRSDNARMSRAIAAYRRSETFDISPALAASIFALLGAGWPVALAGYVDRYGWDGAAAVLSLMTLVWSAMLSAIVLKAIGK
jgi:hypothetical protein